MTTAQFMKMQTPGFSRPGLKSDGVAPTVQVGGLPTDGLVAYYTFDESRNLLKYSQQFDNAAWSKSSITVTPNCAIAPDGTMTATRVFETTANGYHVVRSTDTFTKGLTYHGSVYLKKGVGATAPDIVTVFFGGTAFGALPHANFNLSTGAVVKTSGSSPTIMAVGDGWYRVSIKATCGASGANPGLFVGFCDNNPDAGYAPGYAGVVTSDIYVWGAQLEAGSVPTAYFPTTDKQILRDYANRSRNLLLPNQANAGEDMTTSNSTLGVASTLTSDTAEHWQGSRSFKVVTNNVGATEGILISPKTAEFLPGRSYTYSVYLKGSGTVVLCGYEYSDTLGGPLSTVISNQITLSSEWARYSVTVTMSANGRGGTLGIYTNIKQLATFYVDGLQIEEGSVATEWQAPPNHGILGSAIGSDTNDPTWTKDGASCVTDDYISFGSNPELAGDGNPFTIHTVVRIDAGGTGCVIGRNNQSFTNGGYGWFLLSEGAWPTNTLKIYVYDSDVSRTYRNTPFIIVPGATWLYVTVKFDGVAISLSVRGIGTQSLTTGVAPAINAPTPPHLIYGRYPFAASIYFNGTYAASACYHKATTLSEDESIYTTIKADVKRIHGVELP